MKKKKLLITAGSLFVFCASIFCGGPLLAQDNARVRRLLQDALKFYSEHQYVRALDLFKQVQTLDPDNATAAEYIKSTKQRILEWELQGSEKGRSRNVDWDSVTESGRDAGAATGQDIIAARESLVKTMRSRSTNTDNIVQIEEKGRNLQVTLFHDHLFLPGLQTLRDEALPILDNVANIIRTGGDKTVTLLSVSHSDSEDPYLLYPKFSLPAPDPELPNMKTNKVDEFFQDIESTRAFILFTYLAQKSMGNPTGVLLQ